MNVKRTFGAVVAFLLAVTLIFGTQVNSASAQTSTSGVPVGTITTYAGTIKGNARGLLERQGWLVADGRVMNRSDYPELFAAIGTIYGSGDNVSTFHLPDLRGRFVRGVDDGAGRDPDAKSRTPSGYGGNTGDNVGSLQEEEVNLKDIVNQLGRGKPNFPGGLTNKPYYSVSVGSSVVGSYQETRPKNIYLNYIIKAKA